MLVRSTEDLVLPTCFHPGTLYLKLCLWSQDQPLELLPTHSSLIAKDQPGWYMLCNQTPGRQVQLMFLTVALSFAEPSLMPIL